MECEYLQLEPTLQDLQDSAMQFFSPLSKFLLYSLLLYHIIKQPTQASFVLCTFG